MVKILNEIMKELPENKISSVEFEAANIVVYTNDKEFLFRGRGQIKKLVSKFKISLEIGNKIISELEEENIILE